MKAGRAKTRGLKGPGKIGFPNLGHRKKSGPNAFKSVTPNRGCQSFAQRMPRWQKKRKKTKKKKKSLKKQKKKKKKKGDRGPSKRFTKIKKKYKKGKKKDQVQGEQRGGVRETRQGTTKGVKESTGLS